MTVRVLSFLCLLICAAAFGCTNPIRTGSPCFDSGECQSRACAVTVYGKYCLDTCEADEVLCEEGEACLPAEGPPPDGGIDGGMDGGTDADAGTDAGTDAGIDPGFWCLPGDLNKEDFTPVELGQICTYSLDCVLGGICICRDGRDCDPESEDQDGPICLRICDPNVINQCPLQQVCVDLGNGRGFCDPTTSQPN